jgi:hypothetical protein
MMGRYLFDLGGTKAGPDKSPMRITPEWRGSAPPANAVQVVAARGCDRAPVDLTDPQQALRLKAYVWPDAAERMARLDTAIAMAERTAPELQRADAAEFVRDMLTRPQPEGVTRVLFHTVVWQYLPEASKAAISQRMQAAGAAATRDRPLAWITVETNRATYAHELRIRYWPGGEEAVHLANAHPHGAWIEWLAG